MSEPRPPAFTVLATAKWLVHWGGCNNPMGGIEGQLTKCRLADGLVFYVRESLARDHFAASSGERMAMKRGSKGRAADVLEVCCPVGRWDEVSLLVRLADPLGRGVRGNRRFTASWAEGELRRCASEGEE